MNKRANRIIVSIIFVLLTAVMTQAQDDGSQAYYCAMDSEVSADAPGSCPKCGMALIQGKRPTRIKVGIFIFNNIQILDFTGPYDVFAFKSKVFEVFTIGENMKPIETSYGLSVNPKYTFENCPQPDVLIIPGGGISKELAKENVIEWIARTAEKSQYVMSVCTGSFLIAKAGLLQGKSATTYNSAISSLRTLFPDIRVVSDQRYVDNGKVLTSAGISSGIDLSFHLIAKMKGLGVAQEVALGLEYDWKPNSDYVRAALADRKLPRVGKLPEDFDWQVLGTAGNRESWQLSGLLRTDKSIHETMQAIYAGVQADSTWQFNKGFDDTFMLTGWKLDTDGQSWENKISVEKSSEANGYLVKMVLAKN